MTPTLTQPEDISIMLYPQGGSSIIIDFDSLVKMIDLKKLIYLNGKLAGRMTDILSAQLAKEISDE